MSTYEVGEGFVGAGPSAAHVNTVLGERDGPVGAAFATALATPSAGHAPFLVVARPGVPVQPPTLFVNKAAIAGGVHGRLTWGAAQAGVAAGVADALAEGTIDPGAVGRLVLVCAVWVDPAATADDEAAILDHNRAATAGALRAGAAGLPTVAAVLDAADPPANPFLS